MKQFDFKRNLISLLCRIFYFEKKFNGENKKKLSKQNKILMSALESISISHDLKCL